MTRGYVALMLHAHLPFVRHPEHAFFTEELWLYEAITETYIPLLELLEGLRDDGVPARLTLSLTPTLLAMLGDPLLQTRYLERCAALAELAGQEAERSQGDPDRRALAEHYRDQLLRAASVFERLDRNLGQGFAALQRDGLLEIVTCPATHGFLPLMTAQPRAMRAQIQIAVDHHQRSLGCRPPGIWLGECGYVPGVDAMLREAGLRYFFVDTHALLFASSRPVYGVYAPVFTPTGVAALARDTTASRQVWSATEGYPGDPVYRDFYRDLGFDLPLAQVAPYIHPDGIRLATGLKFQRITGRGVDLADKAPYQLEPARARAVEHARHFVAARQSQVEELAAAMDRPPLVVCPYDAELFGHWWYEGPIFLDAMFRCAAEQPDALTFVTPSAYLDAQPTQQVATPAASSWGDRGYNEVWINPSNDWIYPHLDRAAARMSKLAVHFQEPSELERRALNQAARELLLAQASDWAFIMRSGTAVSYAEQRTREHLQFFFRLADDLEAGGVHAGFLSGLENRDNLFSDLDYRVYA